MKERVEAVRVRLPDERNSVTHKVAIYTEEGELDVYITVGMYVDGSLGEVFVTIGKQGENFAIYDALMTAVSIGIQSGIPIEVFVKKFEYQQFQPAGMTSNPNIPIAKSVLDYVFRWIKMRFLEVKDEQEDTGQGDAEE